MFRGVFKEAGDLLPHGGAHAAHHEAGLHDEQAAGLPADAGGAAEDGLPLAADLAHGLQLFLVAGEVQGVLPLHLGKEFLEGVLVRQKLQPLPAPHAEVVPALAGVPVGPQPADGNGLMAVGAGLFRLAGVLLDQGRGAAPLLQLVFGFIEKVQKGQWCHLPSIKVKS